VGIVRRVQSPRRALRLPGRCDSSSAIRCAARSARSSARFARSRSSKSSRSASAA
jgi:hypothetical protein